MKNGRCRMHGGASLSGHKHPRYKHGRRATTTFEGKMRRAGVEYRRRLRAQRRESRYIAGKLSPWIEASMARRGTYSIDTALRLYRQYRDECRAKFGVPKPPGIFEILFYKPEFEVWSEG